MLTRKELPRAIEARVDLIQDQEQLLVIANVPQHP